MLGRVMVFVMLVSLVSGLAAQRAGGASAEALSRQIRRFSGFDRIYARNLGLEDKNVNGCIDKGAGEGYERFTAKYGDADVGFYVSGFTQGAANGRLETNEIINHYYVHIRFKPNFGNETSAVEKELESYIRATGAPLVWQDDSQGTLINAMNHILGNGWLAQKVSADEAVQMLGQATAALHIRGLTGKPHDTGYYELPEFVNTKAGYCFEMAQFQYWFLSKKEISSSVLWVALTPSLVHAVIRLNDSKKILDYFRTSKSFGVPDDAWSIFNPVQSLSEYYIADARRKKSVADAEKSVLYNKYDISNMSYLMGRYADSQNPNYEEIVSLGEFVLENLDVPALMASRAHEAAGLKDNLAYILSILIESYSATKNREGYNKAEGLLKSYYSHDPKLKPYLEYYKF